MGAGDHRTLRLPPGPRAVPILGMLPALRRDPLRAFMDAALRFGDVAFFRIGSRRGYLITSPSDIRHVLQDNARNYQKSPLYQKLRTSLGDGLLTSEGAFWLRQRRIAQPAFHRQRIAALAGVMAETAAETAAHWQTVAAQRRPVEIVNEMMRLTRTVVLRALLGGDLGPFAATIDTAWATINQRIAASFWSFGIAERLPTPNKRPFYAARAVLQGAVDHLIAERRHSSSDRNDLLSMLMAARDEETGESMTDLQVRVEVTTFLLAGQETTALALTWLVIPYVLHRLPAYWEEPEHFEPERFSPDHNPDRVKSCTFRSAPARDSALATTSHSLKCCLSWPRWRSGSRCASCPATASNRRR